MRSRFVSFGECVGLAVGTALAIGIVHDMITAHVCVEYFTLFHPQIVDSESPVVLALVWGVVATWWVGLPLGVLLGLGNVTGTMPVLPTNRLVQLLGRFAGVLLLLSVLAGLLGVYIGPLIVSPRFLESRGLGPERVQHFHYAAFSHVASYAFGFLGGLVLPFRAVALRSRGLFVVTSSREVA